MPQVNRASKLPALWEMAPRLTEMQTIEAGLPSNLNLWGASQDYFWAGPQVQGIICRSQLKDQHNPAPSGTERGKLHAAGEAGCGADLEPIGSDPSGNGQGQCRIRAFHVASFPPLSQMP